MALKNGRPFMTMGTPGGDGPVPGHGAGPVQPARLWHGPAVIDRGTALQQLQLSLIV